MQPTPEPQRVLPRWEQRFRAARHTLPAWAKANPQRCVFVTDLSGAAQVTCWDRETGALRQVTDVPGGSRHCAVESSGEAVWWFQEVGGEESGIWMRQAFEGGPDEPVSADLGPAWQAGVAIGLGGHALIGRSTEDGTEIHLLRPDGSAPVLYRHEEPAMAVDLSRALDLAAILHSEHGDLWNPSVRVLRPDGTTVCDIGEPGEGWEAVGFAPVVGDPRLLLRRLEGDAWEPVVFDPTSGSSTAVPLGLPGEVDVEWYQDASALLVRHSFRARTQLLKYDLAGGELTALDTGEGTVEFARTRPDGEVWYMWSSAAEPPRFTTLHEPSGFTLPGTAAPASVPARQEWVPGPGGLIHTLVSSPVQGQARHPAVFLLHGGPDEQDRDAFDVETAAWVDHGFAVVRLNYRGSSGYGEEWTQALRGRVGLTELEDVVAVRQWAVDQGIVDPARLVLAGASWGGYLTLLGLGVQPDLWAVGIATAPIADCEAAYQDEREDVQAMDRALFGGSPEDVPERYRESSPVTYADAVRARVLITAALNDPRSPARQIQEYARALARAGAAHEVHWHRSGHSSTLTDERVQFFRRAVAFAVHHLDLGLDLDLEAAASR